MRPILTAILLSDMSKTIKIKKGYDVKLVGEAASTLGGTVSSSSYALKPTDFKNITPRLQLREGSNVKAGDTIFVDKDRPEINFCSPVSGEIVEVKRGEKRKILEILILADKEISYADFGKANPADLSAEQVKEKLLASGAWTLLLERPFGVVANPKHEFNNVFVTGIQSSPLSADVNLQVQGEGKNLQTGINALAKLTSGKVYLSLDGDSTPASELTEVKNAEINYFSGPHPKGNVGVQMHYLAPLNKGEHALTLTAEDAIIIGRLFNEGKLDMTRTIALAGSEVNDPKHYKAIAGVNLKDFLDKETNGGHNRFISGNILTGTRIDKDGYLGFYNTEVSVIPEGDQEEFFAWALPGFGKFSVSRTFFSWLTPNKRYRLNSGMHGEERAFVVTGVYETVFPFDIYPVQLLKSILIRDIEKMEELGIYEVTEEDFALCEVICPSKIPVQEIVREGLNFLRAEVS